MSVSASFSNILKATVNDEVSLEGGSLTKSQKNFSSVPSPSNNRSPAATQRGRREATEEEAERCGPLISPPHPQLGANGRHSQLLFPV